MLLLLLMIQRHYVHGCGEGPLQMTFEIRFGFHFRFRIKPGMLKQLFEGAAMVLRHGEALLNAVLDFGAEPELGSECNIGMLDLGICFKGDVSADHVVE